MTKLDIAVFECAEGINEVRRLRDEIEPLQRRWHTLSEQLKLAESELEEKAQLLRQRLLEHFEAKP